MKKKMIWMPLTLRIHQPLWDTNEAIWPETLLAQLAQLNNRDTNRDYHRRNINHKIGMLVNICWETQGRHFRLNIHVACLLLSTWHPSLLSIESCQTAPDWHRIWCLCSKNTPSPVRDRGSNMIWDPLTLRIYQPLWDTKKQYDLKSSDSKNTSPLWDTKESIWSETLWLQKNTSSPKEAI